MKNSFKRFLSCSLIMAILFSLLPSPWFVARASEQSTSLDEEVNSVTASGEVITNADGWDYCLLTDETIEIVRCSNASSSNLEIPSSIDGFYVSRIGKNAFSGLGMLNTIFIPGSITHIAHDAFWGISNLTIQGWNGSAGHEFATQNNYHFVNFSKFDFFDDVFDLSELSDSDLQISDNKVIISHLYSSRLKVGSRLYLPPCSKYPDGLAAQVIASKEQKDQICLTYSAINFIDAIESYCIENTPLIPDVRSFVVTNPGFSLEPSSYTRSRDISFDIHPIEIKADYLLAEDIKLKGSISWKPAITVSADYSEYQLNTFSYQNSTTTKLSVSVESSSHLIATDKNDSFKNQSKRIEIGRIRLASAYGLLHASAKISLVIDVNGAITAETTLLNTETYIFKNGKITKNETTRMTDWHASAAVKLESGIELALVFTLGFDSTPFSVDIAQLGVSYGFELKITVVGGTDSSPQVTDAAMCCDIVANIIFKGKLDVGILSRENSKTSYKSPSSLKYSFKLFEVKKPCGHMHYESDNGLVSECTHGSARLVTFHTSRDCTVESQYVELGKLVTEPAMPTSAGYWFDAWYKDQACTEVWNFDSDVVTESLTLYANWTPVTGEIIFPEQPSVENSLRFLEWNVTTFSADIENNETVDDGYEHIFISNYQNDPIDLIIPEYIDDLPVTGIGSVSKGIGGPLGDWVHNPAFKNCTSLRSIIIPSTINSIVGSSFYGCSNLETISLPTIDRIYKNTFRECSSLKEIVIPEGVTHIEAYAFADCTNLESIYLPSTLQSIGNYAFSGCKKLSNVSFPSSLLEIGDYAFEDCISLQAIELLNPILSLGTHIFDGCSGLQSVKLAASPSNYCFTYCTSLTNIVFTNSVTAIGENAFSYCAALPQVKLPSNIVSVGADAFFRCESLEVAEMWANPGDFSFRYCKNLSSLILHEGITEIGRYAFADCNLLGALENISLPNTLRIIDSNAFRSCDLREVFIPQSVKTINANAFSYNENLEWIYAGDNVTTIGTDLFYGSDTDKLTIVTTRGSSMDAVFLSTAFAEKLTYVDNDEYWVHFVANGGTGLLVDHAFYLTGSLIDAPNQPVRDNYSFTGWYKNPECTTPWDFSCNRMPGNALVLYAGWQYNPSGFIYEVHGDEAEITGYNGSETHLIIPDELAGKTKIILADTAIPAGIFSVQLGENTLCDAGAFRNAIHLQKIIVPSQNPYHYAIDDVLYSYGGKSIYQFDTLLCYPRAKITETFIPDSSTKTIADCAFYGTSNLKNVTIPEGVLVLHSAVFGFSSSIESVNLPSSLQTVGSEIFAYSTALKSLYVPSNIADSLCKSINIYGCSALEKVVFERDPQSIKSQNFFQCGQNSELYIYGPIDATTLKTYADQNDLAYNKYELCYIMDGTPIAYVNVRAGELLPKPPDPEETSRVLRGWYATDDSLLWDFAQDTMPAADLILSAMWGYDFDFTIKDDGTVVITKYLGNKSRIRIPEEINGMDVSAILPETFAECSGITLLVNNGTIPHIFAQSNQLPYEILTFAITWDANGGYYPYNDNVDIITQHGYYTNPESFGPPAAAKRIGYTRIGWFFDKECTQPLDTLFDAVSKNRGNIILYAGWEKIDESTEEVPFTYRHTSQGVEITGYTGYSSTVEIPSTINNQNVTSIGAYAFYGSYSPLSITLPSSILSIGDSAFASSRINAVYFAEGESNLQSIGDYAFANCKELYHAPFEVTLTHIGSYAFHGCVSLEPNLDLSYTFIDEIGENAFSDCENLESVYLPYFLSSIPEQAFAGCRKLKNIYIEECVSQIAADAFERCSTMEAFNCSETSSYFRTDAGILYTSDGTVLVRYPEGKEDRVYQISDGVSTIAKKAFSNSHLEAIILNAQMERIEDEAFSSSLALKTVEFNELLNYIGQQAFSNCVALREISFPETLESVASSAFSGCYIKSFVVPQKTFLFPDALSSWSETTIYGVRGTHAEDYAIQNNMRFIDPNIDVPIESIQIPLFIYVGLQETALLTPDFMPSNTTEKNVVWSSDDPAIASINSYGYITGCHVGSTRVNGRCKNGQVVTCDVVVVPTGLLPESLIVPYEEITMFTGESRLLDIEILPEDCYYYDAFYLSSDNEALVECYSSYVSAIAPGVVTVTVWTWNGLSAKIKILVRDEPTESVLPSALTIIEEEAFVGALFEKVICPNGLLSIKNKAFQNCPYLVSIYLPDSVQYIAEDAFSGVNNLTIYAPQGSYAAWYAEQNGFARGVLP